MYNLVTFQTVNISIFTSFYCIIYGHCIGIHTVWNLGSTQWTFSMTSIHFRIVEELSPTEMAENVMSASEKEHSGPVCQAYRTQMSALFLLHKLDLLNSNISFCLDILDLLL